MGSAGRPAGSWSTALARARDAWDDLTGGPGPAVQDLARCDCGGLNRAANIGAAPDDVAAHSRACSSILSNGMYSDAAAAAILDTALGLWSDTAASMGEDAPEK